MRPAPAHVYERRPLLQHVARHHAGDEEVVVAAVLGDVQELAVEPGQAVGEERNAAGGLADVDALERVRAGRDAAGVLFQQRRVLLAQGGEGKAVPRP